MGGAQACTKAALTLEGHDVGRDVGQLQQDTGQGGVKHVQAVLAVSGLLQWEPAMRYGADQGRGPLCVWAQNPSVLGLVAGQCCAHLL